jgi:hypothetical protein
MQRGDVDAAVVLHAASVDKRDDKEIVLAAVQRFPKALQFASKRLQASEELLDAAEAADPFKTLSARTLRTLCKSQPNSQSSTFATTQASYSLSETQSTAEEWGSFTKQVEVESVTA